MHNHEIFLGNGDSTMIQYIIVSIHLLWMSSLRKNIHPSPKFTHQNASHFNWTHYCWSKKGESFGRSKTVNAWCLFYPANFPEDLLQIWWNPAHCRMIHHLFTLALPTSITTGHKATGLKPHPLGTELPLPLTSANKPPRRVIPASCFSAREMQLRLRRLRATSSSAF